MHPGDVTPHQAVEVIREYAELLTKTGIDGKTVIDATALSHPKPQILACATLLSALSKDPSERASLAEMARALAFFQPDVAGTKKALSSTGPNNQTWETIVCTDMQSIDATLQAASAKPAKF